MDSHMASKELRYSAGAKLEVPHLLGHHHIRTPCLDDLHEVDDYFSKRRTGTLFHKLSSHSWNGVAGHNRTAFHSWTALHIARINSQKF